MSLNQHFKKWSWLFGIAGFSLMVAAIFVLPQYLKPDLDAGVTFYATEGCAPFKGQCIGRKDNQAITVGLGNEAIESMTEIPIRVHLANMTADSLIVDFEGLEMYMGVVRTQLVPNAQGVYQGTFTLPECGTGKMLWRARAIINNGRSREGIKFDFWAI
ncbi:hypothetical protein SAMN04487869_1426 [Marinobacter sp. DSM 26671]|jgi:hypothetical protein|uniref:YtkA-like domain-containing protein n=1 Tax=Marinobacter manganoxydans MnI7-9 TaxID=1094979 RepID=G6YUL0_9GAMM|nr:MULTISPECIES: hypothetical protein [Marinobacter]EHJ03985.1 hypothetical protein KYE_12385 [Marinobacter manganoxydans MnI7-9]MTI78048.1 hypothetical protein [Marinobacter sp.]SFF02351.1 hypothetical protein SAMN04487869_1426 [Marinobacter sp. DSM 26671]|tara:strand:- start:817 stop:1293 length:477 start_codon:yes stop_codon:yes gene_type:complete